MKIDIVLTILKLKGLDVLEITGISMIQTCYKNLNTKNVKKKSFNIEGEVHLPSWNGFQSRNGVYGSKDSTGKTNCIFYYSIGGDSTLEIESPKEYHKKAFEYLIENQEQIKDSILISLMNEYPNIQDEYDYEPEDKRELMPEIINPNDFKKRIGLSQLHFVNVTKDTIGYIGFEFGCEWDDDHGLGIMTHKDRVIKIGHADTSFMQWVAEEDLTDEERKDLEKEQDLEFEKQRNSKQNNASEKKSPWWKFWT